MISARYASLVRHKSLIQEIPRYQVTSTAINKSLIARLTFSVALFMTSARTKDTWLIRCTWPAMFAQPQPRFLSSTSHSMGLLSGLLVGMSLSRSKTRPLSLKTLLWKTALLFSAEFLVQQASPSLPLILQDSSPLTAAWVFITYLSQKPLKIQIYKLPFLFTA